MDKRKYFFVGTRFYCLEKMIDLGLNIVCSAVIKDSFAEKGLKERNIESITIESKQQLLDLIRNTEFDVLVSNGCPYILPISELRKGEEKYINIHPSLLPDLRGMNPVNGAILFDRPQGTTCHYMDDGIDTGAIISQTKIVEKPDIPLDLLYQLTFMSEAETFLKAYERDFEPNGVKQDQEGTIYYTRKIEDQIITENDDLDLIVRKVRAFQIEGQYARFEKNENRYCIKELIVFKNGYLDTCDYRNRQIIRIYGNNVISKYDDKYLLWRLDNTSELKVGENLLG